MAYTADQIAIEGIPMEQVEYIKFSEKAGEHGFVQLKGYVKAQDGEALLYGLPQYSPLTIRAKDKILFSGVITQFLVTGKGQTSWVEVTAYTRSILMDQEKRCRCFQNTAMTYGELAKVILQEYSQSDILITFPDIPIGSMAVQYQETDWQFLKRMVSLVKAPLTCLCSSPTLKLYAGVPYFPCIEQNFEQVAFRKKLGSYYYWKQLGEQVKDEHFLLVEGNTQEFVELFAQMEECGQKLCVKEHGFQLLQGRIETTCVLQQKEGILAKAEYPMHLIGAALEGTVTQISGIQIRVHLAIDGANSNDVYWFPFSTLSASKDGSGWYYMPEQGDKVRVYFPTKHTKDAVAISAISAYEQENSSAPDRMVNPSTKYLSNPSGQEIRMGADGIMLACKGGAASVTIGNSGDISLYAQDTLLIQASDTVELVAETEMEFLAQDTAVVACAMGGCLQMQQNGNLLVQGTEVKID